MAAKGRQRSGDLAAHTELACQILCGRSSHLAALLTDICFQHLPTSGPKPAYMIWQQRIEDELAKTIDKETASEILQEASESLV